MQKKNGSSTGICINMRQSTAATIFFQFFIFYSCFIREESLRMLFFCRLFSWLQKRNSAYTILHLFLWNTLLRWYQKYTIYFHLDLCPAMSLRSVLSNAVLVPQQTRTGNPVARFCQNCKRRCKSVTVSCFIYHGLLRVAEAFSSAKLLHNTSVCVIFLCICIKAYTMHLFFVHLL